MKISFFYPHHAPSGVSSLFARVAVAAARSGVRARVIDLPDGFMARNRSPESAVELVPFSREATIEIEAEEILVLQAETPHKFRRQLKVDPRAKILHWQLHPYNFVLPLIPTVGHGRWLSERPQLHRRLAGWLMPRQLAHTRAFVELLAAKQSLFFYDAPAARATESFLGCRFETPIFLPVPIAVGAEQPVRRPFTRDHLAVAWVGRLYDFKIHILLHALDRFAAFAARMRRPIVYHIIGDGPESRRLDQWRGGHEFFRVVRVGDLELAEMERYLAMEADLVTAMGTAALHGAALRLPVIVLDLAYGRVPAGYRFRWLHETHGGDLGHTITREDLSPDGADSLEIMLADWENRSDAMAAAAYSYCRQQHDLAAVTSRFIALADGATLRFGDIPLAWRRKSWLRRTYERLRY